MYNFRTDLALERKEIYEKANRLEEKIDGIEADETKENNNIKVSKVKITNIEGEKAIGKPIGSYITIELKNLKIADKDDIQQASEIFSKNLKEVIEKNASKEDEILIVGLGNTYVTPDSLGPKVIKDIDITRHLKKYAPQYLEEGTRTISAISPGVLGTTGIETAEIVKGIVENIKPKMLIVIDSLASKSIERIASTIQISDTGIIPGSGVGNSRNELSKSSLGIPVIAIGVPTVVETAVLVNDCISTLIEHLQEDGKSNAYLNELKTKDNYEGIKESLVPKEYNMIVTPKEVDELINNMSSIVARGINMSI